MMEWWNLAADPKLLAKVNDWLASDIFRTKYRLDFERLFPDSSLKQVLQYLSEKRSIGELLEAAFEAKLNSDEQFYESVIDPVAFDMEQHLEEENEDEDERKAVARRHAHDAVIDESWERGRDHFNSLLDDSGTDEIEAFVIGGVNQKLADLRGKLEAVRQRDVTTSGGFDSAKICFRGFGSENDVSPSNMGIGFSQMMPLVASAFGAENSLIAIEQPELHVHPALQTELADLFIQSAKERGNRFLIETHSEHLILRVMKRIRQTFEDKVPEGKRRITPDDVCVLYVETGENGSIVREMPLNERGELVKGWPGGFFEEAMNEMFEP
jgi:predicted ATP-dependent endonuclease of OLD family